MSHVTVLGLGAMGVTIAEILIARGHHVTVWNRSVEKAHALIEKGAILAKSIDDAFSASSIIVMCVFDYKAATEILDQLSASVTITGHTLVQLTTGSPEDSRKALAWANQRAVHYLDGAIQAAPSQMGQVDTPILLSGDQSSYQSVENLLRELAGNIIYLGEKIDAAATMDAATLSYVYGAITGFTHGARLVESAGLDVAQYGRIVKEISPSFGEFFMHEGSVIHSGDFTVTESPMRISVEATQRILQSSHDAGINTEVPGFIADLFRRADAAGLGDQELASLIKILRA